MKLMVMGHGQHGKGTFCAIAAHEFGLKCTSSSLFACHAFIFQAMKGQYSSMAECYADRHNHRALWYRMILDFNTPDLTRLGRGIFEQHQIYDGIRDINEFSALKSAGLFDLAIWVDASERMPKEDASSISVHRGCADLVIENNDSQAEYEVRVRRVLRALYR